MGLVDTHCHLDMLGDVAAALGRMAEAGVDRCVTIGVEGSMQEAVALAEAHEQVFATVGIHPHEAKTRTDAAIARLTELAEHPKVVGIGEAGLDYHYDNSPRDVQRAVFAEQVRIANALAAPLVVHTREAWDDTFAILADEGLPDRVVFHCFTGGPAEAERALAAGAALSFSGVVTFNSAGDVRAAAGLAPLDRIVVETDSPFLTPVPHRGRQNEPAFVRLVASAIAQVKGVDEAEVAASTTATAARLFGLP
ncbi:MAG TPA: TatD family hydrolase [Actinomycetota bacterium]